MSVLNRFDEIDGYKVQSLIKSNLYTETYRIEDCNSTPYFLKLFIVGKMPSKLVNHATGVVKEIEYSDAIQHRNIVSHIAHGRFERPDGAYQYYITNYFNGQILADKIAVEGKIEEAKALMIFRKVLDAVNYLHQLNPVLCHNDLDVSNIIISDTDKGEPVIIDLGHLAPRSSGNVDFDTSDLSPYYHADESRVNIFDEQGDVFSVCAVLYAMLTGRSPWDIRLSDGGTYKDLMNELHSYRKSNPLDVKSLNVSEKVRYILTNGLCPKIYDRIKTVQEIINMLDGSSEESRQESSAQQKQKGNDDPFSSRGGGSSDDPNQINVEVKRGGGNGFQDIAGMQGLKDMLYKQVIFVLKDRELAEQYRLTPPNGMLLYGPPGCGKTFFAEKFAEETGLNFILIKASDLGSSFVHGSQSKISKLFKLAEQNAPVVVCFDEFDALVPDRSSWGGEHQSGEVNEFLSQMNNCSKRGIFIVATSNRPDKIDPAVLRTGRVDKLVYVPMPDLEARKEMFALYLKKRPVSDDIDVAKLAEQTDGYVASDIAYIVNDAAMTAAFARQPISMVHLETSLANTRPSLRKEVMDSYDRIRGAMEDCNRANNARVIVSGL